MIRTAVSKQRAAQESLLCGSVALRYNNIASLRYIRPPRLITFASLRYILLCASSARRLCVDFFLLSASYFSTANFFVKRSPPLSSTAK